MKVDVYFRLTLNVEDAETNEEALTGGKFEAQRIANEINRLEIPEAVIIDLKLRNEDNKAYLGKSVFQQVGM